MILLGSQNCDLRVTDAAAEDDEDELKRAAHVVGPGTPPETRVFIRKGAAKQTLIIFRAPYEREVPYRNVTQRNVTYTNSGRI